MFNVTNHKTESKVVAITQVVEKTITPDKVTEMYDKVREEIENSILRSFTVSSNIMEGVIVQMHHSIETANSKVMCIFKLNGKEYVTKKEMPIESSEWELFDAMMDSFKIQVGGLLLKETIKMRLNN